MKLLRSTAASRSHRSVFQYFTLHGRIFHHLDVYKFRSMDGTSNAPGSQRLVFPNICHSVNVAVFPTSRSRDAVPARPGPARFLVLVPFPPSRWQEAGWKSRPQQRGAGVYSDRASPRGRRNLFRPGVVGRGVARVGDMLEQVMWNTYTYT